MKWVALCLATTSARSRKPRDLVEPPVYTETAIGIPGLSDIIANNPNPVPNPILNIPTDPNDWNAEWTDNSTGDQSEGDAQITDQNSNSITIPSSEQNTNQNTNLNLIPAQNNNQDIDQNRNENPTPNLNQNTNESSESNTIPASNTDQNTPDENTGQNPAQNLDQNDQNSAENTKQNNDEIANLNIEQSTNENTNNNQDNGTNQNNQVDQSRPTSLSAGQALNTMDSTLRDRNGPISFAEIACGHMSQCNDRIKAIMRDRAMNRYLDFSYRIEDFARNKHYCLAEFVVDGSSLDTLYDIADLPNNDPSKASRFLYLMGPMITQRFAPCGPSTIMLLLRLLSDSLGRMGLAPPPTE